MRRQNQIGPRFAIQMATALRGRATPTGTFSSCLVRSCVRLSADVRLTTVLMDRDYRLTAYFTIKVRCKNALPINPADRVVLSEWVFC